MAERTIEQALNRADGLRMIADFREDYSNIRDQDDIVVLADEVLRLREEKCKQCGCDHATAYELGRSDEQMMASIRSAPNRTIGRLLTPEEVMEIDANLKPGEDFSG
jgi:hypothetical protein